MKQSNIDFAVNSIMKYAVTMIDSLQFDEYIEVGKIVGDALGSAMLSEFKKYDEMRREQMNDLMEQNAMLKEKVEKGMYLQTTYYENMLVLKDLDICLLNKSIERKRETYKEQLDLMQKKHDKLIEENRKLKEAV